MTTPKQIELPTIYGMKTVNAWLFTDPEPVLVDCGEKSEASWAALQAGLAEHGLRVENLSRVVITHAHVDHIGMAGKIVENSQAQVWVSDYVYDWAVHLPQMYERRKSMVDEVMTLAGQTKDSPFRKTFMGVFETFKEAWDILPKERVNTFPIDGTLQMGGQPWEVIYAPGHCINQTCFYQRASKQLISADMLLNITPTPVTDASLEPPYERVKSLPQLLESYDTFSKMEIGMVYPGHYQPFEQAQAVIDFQVRRIHQRTADCLRHIQEGTHDFFELLKKLYPGRFIPPAFTMLIGYLDLLQAQGKIEIRVVDGQVRYFELV